jgi:NAD(P)-dependent dehydrogenase (short-subunit alcohol dehydrogenase family)
MKLADKVVVVTGGGSGIGKALCYRFQQEGARAVVVADIDGEAAQRVAKAIDGLGLACDVADEQQIKTLVQTVEDRYGQIDLFCSNAGVAFGDGGRVASGASNKHWQLSWDINVMAHLYAARAVIPGMAARGGGYLLQTCSAAGLLSQIGDTAYSTTKHAAIGLAEALAISHGDEGIKVSILCPQYVATPMIGLQEGDDYADRDGVISPGQAAAMVVEGLDKEQFLILTHPEVEGYRQHKAANYDRWLGGMRKLRRMLFGDKEAVDLTDLTNVNK